MSKETRPRLLTPLFLLVMLINLCYFTSVGVLIPLLPRYVEGPLGHGNVAVGVVIGAFALAAVLLRPLTGKLGDRRGRKLLVIAGAFMFAAATLGYVWADSLTVLIAWRLLSGAGEAMFYVGLASIVSDLAPSERQGEALSYFSLGLFGGLGIGPVIGEFVLESATFDAAWFVAAALGAAAGTLGFFLVETRPAELLDVPADAAKTRHRYLHPAAFVPGLILAASIWSLATFDSFVPLYVLTIGMSGSRGAFAFHALLVFVIRLFGARIPDALGPARSARWALGLTMLGLGTIAAWASPVGLYVGTGIWSIGHSLAFPALMTMAIKNTPVAERGAAVGTFTAFFDLSFGVGAVSAGAIASALGYRGAFAAASAVAAAGLVGLFLRARARRMAARAVAEAEAAA